MSSFHRLWVPSKAARRKLVDTVAIIVYRGQGEVKRNPETESVVTTKKGVVAKRHGAKAGHSPGTPMI